ncbi:unnamed protein product [Anisakis simplex]|uniref:CTNNB1_binding domain-containing protein n=1 Tax=Anisakis simplex TaxID=6269 RepID=A0A0M3JQN0_ANISI|nr:unnamed protein product [Anisakis simplex]
MSAVEERVAEKRHLDEESENTENGVVPNKEAKLENGKEAVSDNLLTILF